MNALELAQRIASVADGKSGSDVVILNVGEILSFCDAFVIVSATNTRLVGAIVEEIEAQVAATVDIRPAAVEGLDVRRWVLMDYGDVVVHVFLDEERTYYRLERLYGDAPRVAFTPERPGSGESADVSA
jgi:ribosome-associated protein